ncbi:GGDEF domain-containing protein [Eggerthella sinensis]|uniref:GGDEF domain-containing protein n=1 Tax=Eggerthella sinensis TaxID=242230 RepID=UPI0022E44F4E|nr:GGDEF domain-containing protein [Eggerthella sinensis]
MSEHDQEQASASDDKPSEKAAPLLRHDAPTAADDHHGGMADLHSFVFDSVLEGMRTSIYVTDPDTDRILYMNGFMKHDYGVEDPEGKVCWQVLQRGLTERCAFCPVGELLSCGEEAPLVEWDEESPVTGRTYRNYDSLVTWIDGSRVHLQQSVDITALVSANTDELTGMLSRRAGKERLAITLGRAAIEGEDVSVALYDINRLKEVNDLCGHAEGDYLIRSAANAVRREFGPNDYGFRLSGDEFVCVFLGDAMSARLKMERARAALASLPHRTDPVYDMGFCFGIARWTLMPRSSCTRCWRRPISACTRRSVATISTATSTRSCAPRSPAPACPSILIRSPTTKTGSTMPSWRARTTTFMYAT